LWKPLNIKDTRGTEVYLLNYKYKNTLFLNMSFESRYKDLNKEQRLAVDTIDGPVLVIAGPGSGKTELLSLRVANILKNSDVYPTNILCLTFTDSAAKNMMERLSGLIGINAHKVAIYTFHSFALSIMHRFREDFYNYQQMNSADEIIQIETLSDILETIPLSDAFSTKGPDGTYLYIKSIRDRIDKLKKAGITPEEYAKILKINEISYTTIEKIIIPFFEERMSKSVREKIPDLLTEINSIVLQPGDIQHTSFLDYKELIISSLTSAYEKAVEENCTKPLTVWKEEWLKRDSDSKELHLKDTHQLKRNQTLAQIYNKYQSALATAGYIDFNDMIIDVINVLKKKKGILAQLQEQYQYILVDEFQDTNDAQMSIIHLLVDNPVNEGRPNIMVVGDDDQSVYKFQGADINNILQFKKRYPDTKLITLVKNYRSTPAIVDFAQLVISQGEDRLSTRFKEIEKKLEAVNPNIPDGEIIAHTFDTALHEYAYVAHEIQEKIEHGVNPNDIAVIARNHKHLEIIARYLQSKVIPIRYERQRNVLEESHIQQLILLARLIQSIATKNINYQDDLLPRVLSFPFFDLERQTLWELSIEAHKNQKNWISTMLENHNVKLQSVAKWLIDLATQADTSSMDSLIDIMIGPPENKDFFSSPFRQFYFSKERFETDPRKYLQFLSSLNTFINTVRSYCAKSKAPRISDLLDCVDVYQKNCLPITDTSPYLSGTEAVTLLVAHKAKGLEFDTVFVINCQNNIWAKSQGADLIAFPKNLPIDSSGDTFDDYLRIFFVALTRAKHHLYVTSYTREENGKDALQVPFLEPNLFKDFKHNILAHHQETTLSDTIATLENNVFPTLGPIATDERPVLQPLIDEYAMSVTHLNNFLDVTKGGPYYFFEQNFLHFPQAKSASMAYGTAMHKTTESIYAYLKEKNFLPTLQEVDLMLSEKMEKEAMSELDLTKYLEKGKDAWKVYFDVAIKHFDVSHWIETDFKLQHVMIDKAQITGKIDKIIPNEEEKLLEVYDFKTGKYHRDWDGKDIYKKIQLYSYKRQLMFYKLLIEGSRDYSKYTVHRGCLEFLTPTMDNEIVVLPYDITDEDVERLKKIIIAVYKKIQRLDFPDVSKYEQSLEGIVMFENDLIAGNI